MPIESFGPIVPLEGGARICGAVTIAAAMAFTAWMRRAQLFLKRAEHSTWWASTGRDVLHAVSLAALVGALFLRGFRLPAALATGATLFLAQGLALALLFRLLSPHWLRLGFVATTLLLAAPAIITPERIIRGLDFVASLLVR